MGEEGLWAARQRSSGNPAGSSARGFCLLFVFSLLHFLFLLPSFLLPSFIPPSFPPSHNLSIHPSSLLLSVLPASSLLPTSPLPSCARTPSLGGRGWQQAGSTPSAAATPHRAAARSQQLRTRWSRDLSRDNLPHPGQNNGLMELEDAPATRLSWALDASEPLGRKRGQAAGWSDKSR